MKNKIIKKLKKLQEQASRHSGIKNHLLEEVAIDIEQLLLEREKEVREEERERINKYGRRYNKNPERMLKSKHRYHKRIGKKFSNCSLCRKEN